MDMDIWLTTAVGTCGLVNWIITKYPITLIQILKKYFEWSPKWHRSLQDQRYPISILTHIPNFTQFRSLTNCFRVTGYFVTSALRDRKMNVNAVRSTLPHICVTSQYIRVPHCNPFCSIFPFSYVSFWDDKCIKWPPIGLEQYEVNGTPHMRY